ncbi:MAG: preprotein translocase subunit SecE [Armatimonadetes bacterium]|nr:preprotein translocase subunit SecE [Armatimonadota bacterium]
MLGRITGPFRAMGQFFKDVWGELQRVVWPSHEDTMGFTGVVIVAVAIVAVWVGALDLIFTRIVGALGLYD